MFDSRDPGDRFDNVSWDFDENVLHPVRRNNYIYLVRDPQNKTILEKLVRMRKKVEKMCDWLINNYTKFPESRENIKLFLDLHCEKYQTYPHIPSEEFDYFFNFAKGKKHSRTVYNQIPPGTMFLGLNKPKDRYYNHSSPPIGMDGNLNPMWRSIFFDIKDKPTKFHKDYDLINLMIHELSHTMANHTTWKDNNHGEDFKRCENILSMAYDETQN